MKQQKCSLCYLIALHALFSAKIYAIGVAHLPYGVPCITALHASAWPATGQLSLAIRAASAAPPLNDHAQAQKDIVRAATSDQLRALGYDSSVTFVPLHAEGSGDILAVVPHADGKTISFFVGDVKGHGYEASVDALWIQRYMNDPKFREELERNPAAKEILLHINDVLVGMRKANLEANKKRIADYRAEAVRLKAEGKPDDAKLAESFAKILADYYEDNNPSVAEHPYVYDQAGQKATAAKAVAIDQVAAHREALERESMRDEQTRRRTEERIAEWKITLEAYRHYNWPEADELAELIALEEDALHGSDNYGALIREKALEAAKADAQKHVAAVVQPQVPIKQYLQLAHASYNKETHVLTFAGTGTNSHLFVQKKDGSLIRLVAEGGPIGMGGFNYRSLAEKSRADLATPIPENLPEPQRLAQEKDRLKKQQFLDHQEAVLEDVESGDTLIFITDGVTEVNRPNCAVEKLMGLPASTTGKIQRVPPGDNPLPRDPQRLSDALLEGINGQEEDDFAIMVVGIP